MTEQLQEMKARLEAATPGPWEAGGMDSGHSLYETSWWVTAGEGDTVCDMDGLARADNVTLAKDDGGADAQFIAHARTDMPKLIALLEVALATIDTLIEENQNATTLQSWGRTDAARKVRQAIAETLA